METLKKITRELSEASRFACSSQFWKMAVFWTLSLIISYFKLFTLFLFRPTRDSYHRFPPPIMPRSTSSRPVCVITGATSGLGAAAVQALSKEGFCVVLAGRSSHMLSEAMLEIQKQIKDAHLKAFHVDMSSFQSTLKFVESLKQWLSDSDMHQSIQLLINNAGILATSSRLTVDGYDQMMETNYLGAFFLTKLLLPLLGNSPLPSRIVNVTSFTHRTVCLVLFSYELHRQLVLIGKSHQISVNAVDPGVVETNIMREIPLYLRQMTFIALKLLGLLQIPENGVNSILDAALAPPETSGLYFFGGKGRAINSSVLSYNTRLAEKLWTTSSELFLELSLPANCSTSS